MSNNPLRWAIKLSFQRYLAALPDGVFTAKAGVTVGEEHRFEFERVDVTEQVIKFKGDLEFTGHHGGLRVRILDPWFERTSPSAAVITIEHLALRTPFANVDQLIARDGGWYSEHVTLTAEGAGLFSGSYEPGAALEAITL